MKKKAALILVAMALVAGAALAQKRDTKEARPSPNAADMPKIRAKGLGVYAENDARINAGLNDAAAAMRAAGKDYPYTIYPSVGHGFFRTREKPDVADSAWTNVIRFFREQLKS